MTEKIKFLLIKIFSVIFGIAFSVFSIIYMLFSVHYPGSNKQNEWNASQTFEISNIKTIEKNPDKDFVILNLADVQMCDLEDILNFQTIASEIDYLVKTTKPDLITLTGDQTWSNENLVCLTLLISLLERFKIPYAPVFGNHDFGNEENNAVASKNFCADLYERAPHCLFSRGPTNLGVLGNYAINITENGKIFKTLLMLDSGVLDEMTDPQIEWVKWTLNGIKTTNNGISPQTMCFCHKPLPEFRTAYRKYLQSSPEVEVISPNVDVYYSLSGSTQKGVFDILKSYNLTDVVCGHQHGNNFTLKYKDVRLTFALKTGELGGFVENDLVYLNGATSFKLSSEETQITNNFVQREQFRI